MQEPFSRIVRVDALPRDGETVTIEANAEERAALAVLLKLPAIESLSATLTITRAARGGARVIGAVHGEVTQTCVVSLEPFPATVEEEIDVRFAPRDDERAARRRGPEEPETVSMTDDDEPDPIIDGRIDLGALTRGVSRPRPRSLSAQARRRLRTACRARAGGDAVRRAAGGGEEAGVRQPDKRAPNCSRLVLRRPRSGRLEGRSIGRYRPVPLERRSRRVARVAGSRFQEGG